VLATVTENLGYQYSHPSAFPRSHAPPDSESYQPQLPGRFHTGNCSGCLIWRSNITQSFKIGIAFSAGHQRSEAECDQDACSSTNLHAGSFGATSDHNLRWKPHLNRGEEDVSRHSTELPRPFWKQLSFTASLQVCSEITPSPSR